MLTPERAAVILKGARESEAVNGRVIVPAALLAELDAEGLVPHGCLDWVALERLATTPTRLVCCVGGCEAPGGWHVIFEVFPPEPAEGSALGATEFVVCTGHSKTVTPEDFLVDSGWEALCETFDARGIARPDRARTRLVFEAMQ